MNPHIHTELKELKLHLQKHPEQAAQLAVNHLEDYLVLFSEYRYLKSQINQLRQSKIASISPSLFIDAQLTLEQQFLVEVFKRNLASEPNHNKIEFWAMTYFLFFLRLSDSYLALRAELLSL